MHPIPSEYNNVMYRSRLEAKCAVLFDEMGISHYYEPFSSSSCTPCKFPDFLLCKNNIIVFAEVKPAIEKEDFCVIRDEILRKFRMLCTNNPVWDIPILIIRGDANTQYDLITVNPDNIFTDSYKYIEEIFGIDTYVRKEAIRRINKGIRFTDPPESKVYYISKYDPYFNKHLYCKDDVKNLKRYDKIIPHNF